MGGAYDDPSPIPFASRRQCKAGGQGTTHRHRPAYVHSARVVGAAGAPPALRPESSSVLRFASRRVACIHQSIRIGFRLGRLLQGREAAHVAAPRPAQCLVSAAALRVPASRARPANLMILICRCRCSCSLAHAATHEGGGAATYRTCGRTWRRRHCTRVQVHPMRPPARPRTHARTYVPEPSVGRQIRDDKDIYRSTTPSLRTQRQRRSAQIRRREQEKC